MLLLLKKTHANMKRTRPKRTPRQQQHISVILLSGSGINKIGTFNRQFIG